MHQLLQIFGLIAETRILDVGGNEFNWVLLNFSPHVTPLNLSISRERIILHGLLQTAGIYPSKPGLLI